MTTWQQAKWKTPRPSDSWIQQLEKELQADARFGTHKGELMLQEKLAWKGDKLYVPEKLQTPVLQCSRDTKQARHLWFLKTLHLAKQQFWELCEKLRCVCHHEGREIVVDLFSKQAHFIACPGLLSAQRLAKMFLQQIYRLHGVPKCIISNRGVQFMANS